MNYVFCFLVIHHLVVRVSLYRCDFKPTGTVLAVGPREWTCFLKSQSMYSFGCALFGHAIDFGPDSATILLLPAERGL